ncbi:MAG TPA: amidase [Spongiibacteraceae bacterium]|jgi:Asp-tRNA(Asn)/Glu-tRNA(Gln) amidotransferase A subunit family amidase|nr:amidase [Spongiibacteraceae bacterium]HUH37732.1 amidase [Spongiibacteraceae bacterium]
MDNIDRRDFIKAGLTVAVASAVPGLASATGRLGFEDYRKLDALALAEHIRRGDFSAAEVLETAIARAEAVNPTLNCIVEKLYERARAAVRAGLPEGPFTGVPLLLKDLGMMLEGTVTTEGSRFYRGAVATYTSTVVQRYQQAGMVIMGKSASPEFGGTPTTESILFGDTRNPWDLSRSPGGSSGGSAAAVAAGILPVANATDGGGSIRIPASACGLFGMKPSRGRTPHGPHALSSIMSVAHCVSRSVRDSAALLDATRGPELGQTLIAPPPAVDYLTACQRPPGRLRIGLVRTPITHTPVDPECLTALDNAAKLCASLGHTVEDVQLPVDPAEFFGAYGPVSGAGTVHQVQSRERALGRKVTEEDLEPIIWQRYQANKDNPASQLYEAMLTFEKITRQMALLHERYDVLLSPTLSKPPVEIGKLSLNQDNAPYEREAISASAFTSLFNVTGQPAMSVPLHWTPDDLPVGVMFAGRYGEEGLLYQLAGQLEQAQPWFAKVPVLRAAS